MQYRTIQAYRAVDTGPWRHSVKHLPIVAMALLAAYGVASHHVLAVALVLIAGVTFGYRLQHAASSARRGLSRGAQHVDGGSFSGAAAAVGNSRPTVLDGGTERSTTEEPMRSGRVEAR